METMKPEANEWRLFLEARPDFASTKGVTICGPSFPGSVDQKWQVYLDDTGAAL